MLYDNAQLASAHLLAFEVTGDPRWRHEAEATFAFVARTMTAPEGGFYSALDAETDGEEGAYYVWTRDEVEGASSATGRTSDAFAQVYGLTREPNFEEGRYVLLEPRTRAEQAERSRPRPRSWRRGSRRSAPSCWPPATSRPAPLRDDKVLTGLERPDDRRLRRRLPRAQGRPRYRQAAEKAADFLLAKLRTPDGRLLRTYRAGQAQAARPTSKTTPSSPTACSGSTPRPATRSGWRRPGR